VCDWWSSCLHFCTSQQTQPLLRAPSLHRFLVCDWWSSCLHFCTSQQTQPLLRAPSLRIQTQVPSNMKNFKISWWSSVSSLFQSPEKPLLEAEQLYSCNYSFMNTIKDNQIVPGIFKSTQKPGEYKPITSTPHKYVLKKRTSQSSKP
jgi:hypothetical protein